MSVTVRDIVAKDKAAWELLWIGYLDFYEEIFDPIVTDTTWARFLDPNEPMFALVAENDKGELIGFVHCVLHRGTWAVQNICYLEDLFVVPHLRGTGAGRALIEAVYARADALNHDRVYWLTHETNTNAQKLYDRIAHRTGFIHYRR